ncbi:MAG: hypothetical protein JWO36_2567 [Myxococcales bacterium]|nr:hypothetical protein [Myxococcales bacterium]
MRNLISIIVAAAALQGCKWTEFDDLAATTWVGSQTKPNGESASDYAVVIVNAASDPTGGKLAVLGNDKPSYSTLAYDATGKSSAGPNQTSLGIHFIVSLGEAPILIADASTNKIAIVSAAIDSGNVAVVSGAPDSVADQTFQAQAPQAATFANGNVVIVAGDPVPTVGTNIYTMSVSPPAKCTVLDDLGMPLSATAIASDGTLLWVWTKTGALFGYTAATVMAGCATPKPPDTTVIATGFIAGTGARIHIVQAAGSSFAVLVAHGDKVTTGQVIVANLQTKTIVGTPLTADGIRSSAVGPLGDPATGKWYVVLGLPERVVGTVTAGQVELHEIDPMTGMLTAQGTALYNDAQPTNLELFGRSVAIMKFNGKNILAVAASNEIFAYFESAQYLDTRLK